MAIGSKANGKEEYVFLNGHVMRSDEAIRIQLDRSSTLAPGQKEANDLASKARAEKESKPARTKGAKVATGVAAAGDAAATTPEDATKRSQKASGFGAALRRGFKGLEEDDALALRGTSGEDDVSFELSEHLRLADKHAMRTKYLAVGGILLAVTLIALCISPTQPSTFHTPIEVAASLVAWVKLTFLGIAQSASWHGEYVDVVTAMPYYSDCITQAWLVLKFIICGALLALAGMLYQNTFRNPIAAPSILGISNGINIALVVLVLQYGYTALQYPELYYLYSFVSGTAVLLIVMLGGKAISGKGNFNTVNLILIGTVISQLLGVIITYLQAYFMDDAMYEAYEILTLSASSVTSAWSYATVLLGGLIVLVPVVAYRFKLNLISFTDEEARLLGANPTRMRVVALGCGSLMLLIAQLNLGQIAMASLIVPFIAREIFGSEFRKQLYGNLLIGALLMLACGALGSLITFEGYSVGISAVVAVVAVPLFVWILAIQQRSWE